MMNGGGQPPMMGGGRPPMMTPPAGDDKMKEEMQERAEKKIKKLRKILTDEAVRPVADNEARAACATSDARSRKTSTSRGRFSC